MATIDVDFEVYKALTNRRETETTTYNDVIRQLLQLPAAKTKAMVQLGQGWVQKGVSFPNGTEFRATYKGKTYLAHVADNQMMLNGKAQKSLSEAATSITNNSVNGWRFWECRFPGGMEWRVADAIKA